ncbi:sialoadhesin-like, partial [Silurus asotus]
MAPSVVSIRIVALQKDGRGYEKINNTLKLSSSTVARVIQRFSKTGSIWNTFTRVKEVETSCTASVRGRQDGSRGRGFLPDSRQILGLSQFSFHDLRHCGHGQSCLGIVLLTERPKPVASINPDKQVFSGDTVTLRCEIQDESVFRWQYSWYKDASLSPVSSVQMYTISSVRVTHTGKYTCKGRESGGSRSSHLSDAVTLTVSARPKPEASSDFSDAVTLIVAGGATVASINPDKQVFRGDTVTLRCEIQDESVSRWQYSWYKDASLSPVSSVQMYSISSVEVTHTGKYTCKGRESGGSRSSHLSDAVTLTVSVKPKPVASINPDKQVFSGDTVTLRCEIQDESVSRWQYSWYKDASLSPVSSVQMYTISSVEVTHTGKYTCKGRESGGSRSSHLSDAVTLTVSERPKPVASINPDKQMFSGDTVTLRCEIQDESVSWWQHSWYKDASLSPVSSVQMYRISSVEVTHTGKYTCKGRESGGSRSSHLSDAVTLTVSARPKPVASINPDQQVFSGETVFLRCEIQDESVSRWQYSWYKDASLSPVSSVQMYTISSVEVTHTGKYTCSGKESGGSRSSHLSDAVTLTVSARPKPVASINPDKQVFSGDTVTLRCEIQDESVSRWQYSWYKEASLSPVSSVQMYTISSVEVTHTGKYTCKGRESGGSRSSHLSDAVTLTVSERPKPVASINPDKQVFSGDTVTLRCEIQDKSVSRWQYSWYKDASHSPISSVQMYRISSVEVTHTGKYTCKGKESGGSRSSHLSDAVTLTVTVKPKSVVSINPDKQVFSGDTVTLRCEIQDESVSRWQYSWYKDASLNPVSSVQMYTISSVEVTHTGKYTCEGRESGGSRSSHLSDAVTLTVSVKPKPVASINPDKQVFSGDTVTLRCEIQDESVSRWQYSWYKDASLNPVSSVQMYTISSVEVTHTGKYTCEGRESGGSHSSHLSDAVTLTVSARPKPVASINPDKQVFSGDTVTLRCEIQNESVSRWQYSWYKDASLSPVSSVQMYRIRFVRVTHTGKYTCKGRESGGSRSSHLSDAVTLTVSARPKPVASINPDKQVFSGDTVTLRCEIQDERVSRWQYSWYKDASLSPVSSVQMYRIRFVRVTHTGKYTCKGRESGDSRSSHLSDAVTLTVSERLQAVLSVSPQNWLTERDSVTLSCEVTDSSTDWTFSWYTVVPYRDGVTQIKNTDYVMYVELLSNNSRGSGGNYTLSPSALYHTGVYVCRGERGEPVSHTLYSNPQPLWISGESPPVSLIISPSRTQHFTRDSLSLSCEDQSNTTGWTVRRYTDSEGVLDCSQWGSVTGATCNISFLSTSYTGVYWCESESGANSSPVNITVH